MICPRCGRNGVSGTELTNSPCPVGRQLNPLTLESDVKDYNTSLPPAEYVAVDSYLQHQLMIAEFTHVAKGKPEPYFVKIENCFPCVGCGFPIARLQVAGYVRVVDCYRDKSTLSHWNEVTRWQADVLSEHVCNGRGANE